MPIDITKVVPIPRQSGTITIHQKGVGTGTDLSGTGTNASHSPDICVLALLSPDIYVLALLSPNSYTDGIGTLTNY